MEGNQIKIRDALLALRNRFNNNVMAYQDRYFKFSGWHWHKKAAEAARWRDVFHELREVCDAALSTPARNCDLARDWLQDLYCHFKPPANFKREMPPEWVDAIMAFCRWLLTPAAERKGEKKNERH